MKVVVRTVIDETFFDLEAENETEQAAIVAFVKALGGEGYAVDPVLCASVRIESVGYADINATTVNAITFAAERA